MIREGDFETEILLHKHTIKKKYKRKGSLKKKRIFLFCKKWQQQQHTTKE